MKKVIVFLVALPLMLSMMVSTAFASNSDDKKYDVDLPTSFYYGKTIGVVAGTINEEITDSKIKDAQKQYYPTIGDMSVALDKNMIDGYFCNIDLAKEAVDANPKLGILKDIRAVTYQAFAFGKSERGDKIRMQMNDFIKKLEENGELEKCRKGWIENGKNRKIDFSGLDTGKDMIHYATLGSIFPSDYIQDNQLAGYEVELVVNFCREYGYGLTCDITNGIIAGISTGMYDLDGTTVSEERKEEVNFSESYGTIDVVMVVRKSDAVNAGEALTTDNTVESKTFIEKIEESFVKTFIKEDRWKMILDGIKTTIFISFFAVLFGSILGFGLCMLRIKHHPVSYKITSVIIRILQGVPLLVLLMVLFYVVFPKTGLSGAWVAVITFSISFSTYVCEMMRTAIESIDGGQREAALALGYTERRAFSKYIFPQALQIFMPVYKGEFISIVKQTSIVGYIAVQDLNKVSDIIRSRTYEAFFPIVMSAIIYFAISYLLTVFLNMIEIKTLPDRNKKTLKGVKLDD